MQVTETNVQGLKREYKVVFPAAELAARLDGQIAEMKDKIKLNGFRPGKVPSAHIRRVYGKSIMNDVVQELLKEANQKIVQDHALRLAGQPKLDVLGDAAEIEKVLAAEGDFAFKVAVETLPTFEVGDLSVLEVEKIVVDVRDSDIEGAISRMADRMRSYKDKSEKAQENVGDQGTGESPSAEKGDKLTIDFVGKINDEAFEGGTSQDIDVVLGSDSFIPGFEHQLIGAKKGEQRVVSVTFPENYASDTLAGKAAMFDVTVKNIESPEPLPIDDEFASKMGFETLEALRKAAAERITDELGRVARAHTKRHLLDAMDKLYSFELPEGLVEDEFNGVWQALMKEQEASGKSFADEGSTEEKEREDYRKIAERRVRLGLVLAEVGDKAGVKVDEDEVMKGVVKRARSFPGQEQAVWDYYRNNPQALGEIRAPLYEEKVVDHILGLVKTTERKLDRDELMKLGEELTGDE